LRWVKKTGSTAMSVLYQANAANLTPFSKEDKEFDKKNL